MNKIISMMCVVSLLGATSAYAQSKKEIIAAQQNQIQTQQHQLDSLRVANAYLQGAQDQLSNQVGQLNASNTKLSQQNLQLQHQIDSLSLLENTLRRTLAQKELELQEQRELTQQQTARADKLQREQNRQKKAQAEQQKAQQEKENQEFQQMLADYRSGCENSEQKLRDFFDKDKYHTNRFSQTKTMLLAKYEQQCQAGKATSLDQVKWDVQHNEGRVADTTHIGNPGIWQWYKHQYKFMVECPDGRSYQAYEFCFETHLDYDHHYEGGRHPRVFSGFIPCQEDGSSLDIH